MAPAGKGAGGGEFRIARAIAERRHGRRGIRRADPLGGEPGGDAAQRAATREPALRPDGGIGGIVEEPACAIPCDERIDQRSGRAHGLVIAPETPAHPALQDSPQILGRARKALQVVERARLQPLGRRRRRPAPTMLRGNHRPTMP